MSFAVVLPSEPQLPLDAMLSEMDKSMNEKRIFAFLTLALLVCDLLCAPALSSERYFTEEQIAAEGRHCVTGYFCDTGGMDVCVKFYDGNADDLNVMLSKFVSPVDPKDAPFVPRFVSRKVVMHATQKRVLRLVRPDRTTVANWSITTWKDSGSSKELHLVIDIYTGGGIDVDGINLPKEFEAVAKKEFDATSGTEEMRERLR